MEGRGGDGAAVKRRRLDGAGAGAGGSDVGTGVVRHGSHRAGAHVGSVGQVDGGGDYGSMHSEVEEPLARQRAARREAALAARSWEEAGDQAGEEVEQEAEGQPEDEELRLDTVGAVCVDAAGAG